MLYAYPREFRLQYGVEMQQFFHDRCRELAVTRRKRAWFRFGLRNVTDWIVSTVRERRAARKVSGIRKLVQEWAVTLLLFLFVTTYAGAGLRGADGLHGKQHPGGRSHAGG